ncbi:MAG: hypothetical protein KDN22_26930 [Verrucomicrobiae bacterium]|nr:hypothetical protein [Verrucomicrobiae bacterium]
MTDTLEKAYRELRRCDHSESFSQTIFDLVDQLIRELGEERIAERILDLSHPEIPWEDTAAILAVMVWSTSDNGAQISRDAERWISECKDERRAFVALNLDCYPFLDPSEMEASLCQLAEHFPALSDRCHAMIVSRNQQADGTRTSG